MYFGFFSLEKSTFVVSLFIGSLNLKYGSGSIFVLEGISMGKTAAELIAQARAWIGCRESDGSHRKIIDIYNSHRPLARGYAVRYTDAWCAAFVSACAIRTGMTDIIPTECGCGEMVKLFRRLGEWDENDARRGSVSGTRMTREFRILETSFSTTGRTTEPATTSAIRIMSASWKMSPAA